MRPWAWLAAVTLVSILEASTGWFQDAAGRPVLDLVLVLTLVCGAMAGTGWGVASGVLAGLLVGAPGNLGVQTALIYGTSGGLAGHWMGRGGVRAISQIVGLGVATTIWLSFVTGTWGTVATLALHNLEAVAIVLLVHRLTRRSAAE